MRQIISSGQYEAIARAGLTARAVVYGLIAALMVRAATLPGHSEEGYSPTRAFESLETALAGRAMLLAIAGGLLVYALWRFMQAGFDARNEGRDATGGLARAGMAASGIAYLSVAIAAVLVTLGENQSGGAGTTQKVARFLLDKPFGRFGLGLVGLFFAGVGLGQTWRVVGGKWQENIDLSGWARRTVPIINFAIAGRGLLFLAIGGFVFVSAWQQDASDAKGLAATLAWARGLPYGFWLYLAGALVLGAYAVYSLVQARRTRTPG